MDKDELTSEELFLKEGDYSAKLPLIDVHDSVMEAIGLGNGSLAVEPVPHPRKGSTPGIMQRRESVAEAERTRKGTLRRHAGRWATVLTLVVLVGGGYSLSIENFWRAAKFQYEVLPYEPLLATQDGGKIEISNHLIVPMESENPPREATTKEKLLSEKYFEAYKAVEKLLLPGEAASYMLEEQNAGDERPQLGRVVPPMLFNEYSSYLAKTKEYMAPHLPQPEYMPEGYVFDQAWIQPDFEVDENELIALAGGIKLEGGYQVKWRKEPSDNINYDSSALRYKNGESMVKISAKRIKAKTGTVETLLRTKNTSVENIRINGNELIFTETTSDELKLGYRYRLVWANPEQNILYDLTAEPKSFSLSKEQMIRIAAGVMK